jgi:alpha-tubulin suppressor-like RCC1 family protein
MDKYHTLFLSDNGSVYSCGFGVGGRLGHDNEDPVLVRKICIEKFNPNEGIGFIES